MEDFDEDDENRDWWTKYFASVEAMIEVTTYNKAVILIVTKSVM